MLPTIKSFPGIRGGHEKQFLVEELEVLQFLNSGGMLEQNSSTANAVWILSDELAYTYNITLVMFNRFKELELIEETTPTNATNRFVISGAGRRYLAQKAAGVSDTVAPEEGASFVAEVSFPVISIDFSAESEWREEIEKVAVMAMTAKGTELSVTFNNVEARDSFLNEIGFGNVPRSAHLRKRK